MNIERAKKIHGWMNETELEFLAQTAAQSNLIIEFGCYKGRSTRALADNTKGKVIAVDPWNGDYPDQHGGIHSIRTDVYDEFIVNLKDKIDDGTVTPIREYSTNFKYQLGRQYDFIFIDGDHRYEIVKLDIVLGLHLLKPGGILAGHDYTHCDWPGVKKAVDEFYKTINLVESIWWIKK
jgi:predicted O-methyltransferase YrrM